MPVKSKAQARLFGLIAGGGTPSGGGPSESQAREALRGTKVKNLPEKAADYNPQDETIGDWAQRKLEQEMRKVALDAARAAVPQTPPVGQATLADQMRNVADALTATEESMGPLTELPTEVAEVVDRLQDDLEFVLHWLEEHGSQ